MGRRRRGRGVGGKGRNKDRGEVRKASASGPCPRVCGRRRGVGKAARPPSGGLAGEIGGEGRVGSAGSGCLTSRGRRCPSR